MPYFVQAGDPHSLKPMTFTNSDYPGYLFANPEDVRKGPLGEVSDYQIVSTPNGEEAEIGCWLTLSTANMIQH